MKYLICSTRLLIYLLSIPLFYSCEKKADEFSNSEPVTYYLSDRKMLTENAGPDGTWFYISNYIYPTGSTTSCEWSVHLNHNITRDAFGYDLLFWSASQSRVRIDYILLKGTVETVLASKELDIEYINETTGIQRNVEIKTNPLKGINPKSGKDSELILRITHISGTDPVEVLFDANIGMLGCTSITVYQDM
jgi:hypothetical protein